MSKGRRRATWNVSTARDMQVGESAVDKPFIGAVVLWRGKVGRIRRLMNVGARINAVITLQSGRDATAPLDQVQFVNGVPEERK